MKVIAIKTDEKGYLIENKKCTHAIDKYTGRPPESDVIIGKCECFALCTHAGDVLYDTKNNIRKVHCNREN